MSIKYHASTTLGNGSAASPAILRLRCSAQVITNDLFLAAFLSSVGCTLDSIEKNERRRVSFVFSGERCRELREAYRTGPVKLDMRTFRETLNELRDRMGKMVAGHHPEERSAYHASPRSIRPTRGIASYAHG